MKLVKHERKTIAIVFALIVFSSIMLQLSGCSKSSTATSSPTASQASTTTKSTTTTTSQLSSNVLVQTTDQSVSISVPSGWNTNDTALYPGAVIGVANDANSEYVIVTKKPKSEIGTNSTVSDYMTVVKNVFAAILNNPVWGQTSNVTIGGCKGLSAQLTGTKKSDGSSMVYYVNALASDDYYYNVCGYTTSNMADANKTNIENIIKSFKETN
jgi:hypothetical protein